MDAESLISEIAQRIKDGLIEIEDVHSRIYDHVYTQNEKLILKLHRLFEEECNNFYPDTHFVNTRYITIMNRVSLTIPDITDIIESCNTLCELIYENIHTDHQQEQYMEVIQILYRLRKYNLTDIQHEDIEYILQTYSHP